MINRRRLLAGASLAAVGTLAAPSILRAQSGQTVKMGALRLVHSMPPHFYEKFAPAGLKIEIITFDSPTDCKNAVVTKSVDLGTFGIAAGILGAAAGEPVVVVGAMSNRGMGVISKAGSDVKSIKDLKGKTIGINGHNSSIHLWALLAVQKAGLDPAKDVTFAPVPFPAQGEALRSGKIDVGAFPQPFAKMEQDKGGVTTLFTSKDGVPFDEELMLLVAKPDFAEKNQVAVRAFLADLVAATKYYDQNPKAARQALLDAKFVRLPETVYFDMLDYYRDPNARIDVEALKKMQDLQINVGWQDKPADINALVDLKYLPK